MWRICCIALVVGQFIPAFAEEKNTPEAQAPPNHEILKHVRGGVIYIAKPLKERYDAVRTRLLNLNADLNSEKITPQAAIPELQQLQAELNQLRQEIEKKKVLVTPLEVHQQEETTLFDLGPTQCLVITTDQLELQSWDGPQIKCVLVKNVMVTANEKPDNHFKALRVVHQYKRAKEMVGRTAAEVAAEESEYLASPDGKKLTPEQQAGRFKFVQEIAGSFSAYREFQGKEIDTLAIEGLTHEQGNRHQTIRTKSVGGGGSLGGDWQRSAKLVVFVPEGCRNVAVRGCQVGLDIHDLKSGIVLTSHDSHDRDYEGEFNIRRVQGAVSIDNVPIHLIENIRGNVTLIGTEDFGNSGTNHADGMRTAYTASASECSIREIDGNLSAWVGRVSLNLEGITGAIDIRNEFGNTVFNAGNKIPEVAHRILSQSGAIDVRLSSIPPETLPLLAMTNYGKVTTNLRQDVFDDKSFTVTDESTQSRRNWRGMMSVQKEKQPGLGIWQQMQRPNLVWNNSKRSPGLDLISRAGSISVMLHDR